MTDPAADRRPALAPKMLGGLVALACVACCALPVLIAAGVVGTGVGALVGWLPAVAIALAVVAVGVWWLGWRRWSCSCGGQRPGGSGFAARIPPPPCRSATSTPIASHQVDHQVDSKV